MEQVVLMVASCVSVKIWQMVVPGCTGGTGSYHAVSVCVCVCV